MPSPRRQIFRVLHRALFSCGTQLPYRPIPKLRIKLLCAHLRKSFWFPSMPKPKHRTFICVRCARLWKSSRLLLTPKTKLLMNFTPRIARVLLVLSLKKHAIAAQCLQGYPRSKTTHTFPFTWCLKTVHRNSLIAYCHCPTRVVRGSSFMCVV